MKLVLLLLLVLLGIYLIPKGWKALSGKIASINQVPTPTALVTIVAQLNGFGITNDVHVVKNAPVTDVPVIQASVPTLFGGETLKGNGIESTVLLLPLLKEKNIAVQSIDLFDESYSRLILSSGAIIVYNSSIEPTGLATSLQTMLSLFTIEGKAPKTIDLRFGKPVVTF